MTRSEDAVLRARLEMGIRDVADFPRPGVVFKDVTPLLGDAALFRDAVEAMSAPFRSLRLTHVVAIESRGFLFGAPVAMMVGAGVVPVRKQGKLPHDVRRAEYELEYGADALEIHADALDASARVLVVDDVLATGGTARTTAQLVELLGGVVVGFSFLIELAFLNGRIGLAPAPVAAVLRY